MDNWAYFQQERQEELTNNKWSGQEGIEDQGGNIQGQLSIALNIGRKSNSWKDLFERVRIEGRLPCQNSRFNIISIRIGD